MGILDHNEDRVVIKRLKRITEERKKLDLKRAGDPFKKTFLEKVRDVLGLGVDGSRQHWIKAKLHWFAGSEFRRDEITQEIDKSFKISRAMQMINKDNQGVNYAVETYDPMASFDESGQMTDEYLSLLRNKEAMQQQSNDMDFSISGPQKVIALESSSGTGSARRITCDDSKKVNPEFKKSTTELFLSVHNYMQDKEKNEKVCQEIEKPKAKEGFAATKLWAQSNDYMPGEQWDPEVQSFEPIPDMKVDDSTKAKEGIIDDASRMIGMLLAKADPSMLAVDAV